MPIGKTTKMSEWTGQGEDAREGSSPTMTFQDGVTNLLMQTEELRRKLDSVAVVANDVCFQMLDDVDGLLARLYSPPLAINPENGVAADKIEVEMRNLCLQKTTSVAMQALRLAVKKKETDPAATGD